MQGLCVSLLISLAGSLSCLTLGFLFLLVFRVLVLKILFPILYFLVDKQVLFGVHEFHECNRMMDSVFRLCLLSVSFNWGLETVNIERCYWDVLVIYCHCLLYLLMYFLFFFSWCFAAVYLLTSLVSSVFFSFVPSVIYVENILKYFPLG